MHFYPFKKTFVATAMVLCCLTIVQSAHAVPYFGEETFTYYQPDGSTFPVKLYGDEFFAYQRTLEGFEVVLDEGSGFWCYAMLSPDGRSFVSTGVPVVTKRVSSAAANKSRALAMGNMSVNQKLPPDVVIDRVREAQAEKRVDDKGRPLRMDAKGDLLSSPPTRTTVGDYTGLCILVDFYDEVGTISTAQVDAYCNQPTGYSEFGNACSINEYYRIQSNGKLNFFNTVVGYVRMPLPKTYYDNNEERGWGDSTAQQLVETALNNLMATGFDFTRLTRDGSGYIYSINVFYAGSCTSGWSRGLWPHSWAIPSKVVDAGNNIIASSYQMTDMETSLRIGTFCHENGHMTCDFPDLYSYIGGQNIVGSYSLMCTSGSTHPRNIDPYLKMNAGWSDIVEVTAGSTMRAVAQVDRNFYYKLRHPSLGIQYFLIENRDDIGYEGVYNGASACAPGQGLVVWQAHESGSNTFSTIQQTPQSFGIPYELFVVEATPTTSYTPWYSNPYPSPGSGDTFYSGHGANPLNDVSSPDLHFWNHVSSTGRTVNSNHTIRDYSARDAAVTYTIGSGSLPATPAIGITTASIGASCDLGSDAVNYVFYVYNSAGGTLAYSITDTVGWLACTPASGSLTTGTDAVTVTFTTSALVPGSYNASIEIAASGASNTPQTIPVTLTVAQAPSLLVEPQTLNVSLMPMETASNKYFVISNAGGGSMTYAISTTAAWITPISTSGQCINEMDLIYLDIDTASLSIGTYSEDIEIVTAGSTQYVTVNLNVHEALPAAGIFTLVLLALVICVCSYPLLKSRARRLS